ncbi:MAG: CpsD/CapB family tyrosine-protein kinase [Clostridia bacterium]|nr:CpsD/CapB family tyrosine-protein kinase [Clostridia bacterium]
MSFLQKLFGGADRIAKNKTSRRNDYLVTENVSFATMEAFRHLKASLSVSMPRETGKKGTTIMMTSACPADGKTMVAVNIALTYAMSNAKIVLVDADVRKGRVARYFRKKSAPGLTDCLAGQVTLEEVTHKLPENENFSYITCGTHSPRPYELLESEEMKALLNKLKETYDYIIIDTPPVLLIPDALALVPEVDGTVVVCRHEVSFVSDIAKTLNTLSFAKANVLGVVVNDYTSAEKKGGYYGKYYYYEYAEAMAKTDEEEAAADQTDATTDDAEKKD